MKTEAYLTTLYNGIKDLGPMIGYDERFKLFLQWVLEVE